MISNATRIALEQRIVRGLIRHMKRAGWQPFRVNDGEMTYVHTEQQAMDAVFAVDEASLRFIPAAIGPDPRNAHATKVWRQRAVNAEHGVLLILGNGEDVISDWNYTEGDADGFDAAMDAFSFDLEASHSTPGERIDALPVSNEWTDYRE